MTRPLRVTAEDIGIYHVVIRGNNRIPVFLDADDHLSYLAILAKYKALFGFKIFHYILMPNHVHLMLNICNGDLSDIMKRINLSYSLRHRRKYERTGHLWEKRFWSEVIQDERYFMTCAAYIELNCVRAGIVSRPADYRWSSYNVLVSATEDNIVDFSEIYLEFGLTPEDRIVAYKAVNKLFADVTPPRLNWGQAPI